MTLTPVSGVGRTWMSERVGSDKKFVGIVLTGTVDLVGTS